MQELPLYVVVLGFLVIWHKSGSLPPGPRRLPIIGNVFQMPQTSPWLTFTKWAKTYGDIMHVDVVGKHMVVLNSAKVARELLDKRSLTYSDRPHFVMVGDLAGFSELLVFQSYGEEWRKQRKLIAQEFTQASAPRYYSLQESQARILAWNILRDPSSLFSQVRLRIGINIIQVTYGYTVKGAEDPFITGPLQSMQNFSEGTVPGSFLVDFIPALKYVPNWMPGAGFFQKAKAWRQVLWDASWAPYLWLKENQNQAISMPNLCASVISDAGGELSREEETRLVWAASTVMGGGLDSNMSTVLSFFLAMALYPEIQSKAQAEVDAVVGFERLPEINDKTSLPYVRSIVTEVMRWRPAMPLGIPHAANEDGLYNGLYIPKGSVMMANVWNMLHDPKIYSNPSDFNPDRYKNLDSEMQKVFDVLFGFGRRACPGFHFAEGTIFAIVLTLLATCDILPPTNEEARATLNNLPYTGVGIISFPENFEVRLKPRSSRASLLADVIESLDC
ncbi:putative monooxygenase [Crucibulum laeve]|uniref:Putative monooxygenase n=1 Tax=Crucibulum laeve TaxID=68775 RepID=A0A5C3LHY9_9AGAR|nr:putative monooxygenase [Crucibulum laeve]